MLFPLSIDGGGTEMAEVVDVATVPKLGAAAGL